MNRDKLIEMLMQAGFEYTSDLLSKIDKFEKLLEIEREECARLCDWLADRYADANAVDCSELIRYGE